MGDGIEDVSTVQRLRDSRIELTTGCNFDSYLRVYDALKNLDLIDYLIDDYLIEGDAWGPSPVNQGNPAAQLKNRFFGQRLILEAELSGSGISGFNIISRQRNGNELCLEGRKYGYSLIETISAHSYSQQRVFTPQHLIEKNAELVKKAVSFQSMASAACDFVISSRPR